MKTHVLLLTAALLVLGAGMARTASAGDPPCLQCHEDAVKAFTKGPHGVAMAAKSPAILSRACVACHGTGDAHMNEPTKENIRKPDAAACLSCHPQARGGMDMATPGHLRNGVECLDCHTSGHGKAGVKLLKSTPAEVCGKCHPAELSKFNQPYAHRKASKPFSCLDCHSPHGTGETGRLARLRNGGACIKCHTEKAGPFIYPHPPREVDGCLSCHEPHGSPNPRLLNRFRVADLCLECHTGVPAFHDFSKSRYQNCLRCHVAVHGSNRTPALFND